MKILLNFVEMYFHMPKVDMKKFIYDIMLKKITENMLFFPFKTHVNLTYWLGIFYMRPKKAIAG